MEEIIKRIIQIEEEAADIEKQTAERILQSKAEQNKRIHDLSDVLKKKSRAKVDTLREREMKEVEEEIIRQHQVAEKQIEQLEQVKMNYGKDWAERLFAEIVKE